MILALSLSLSQFWWAVNSFSPEFVNVVLPDMSDHWQLQVQLVRKLVTIVTIIMDSHMHVHELPIGIGWGAWS